MSIFVHSRFSVDAAVGWGAARCWHMYVWYNWIVHTSIFYTQFLSQDRECGKQAMDPEC